MPFFGHRVVRAAFVMAVFGWGVGLYGPPVFLHAVIERTGWPLPLVSSAVTVHYLIGALVVAQLARLHGRFGVGPVAVAGALLASVGMLGWAAAREPWQLFVAAGASGAGWVGMGAVAINAVIAPWFVSTRPKALGQAYNGASIGGVVFTPLWVALIAQLGFVAATLAVGLTMLGVMGVLSRQVFSKTPQGLGQFADGQALASPPPAPGHRPAQGLPGVLLWRDRHFRSLAAGMALGLFAQIGLIAHLFALLVPVLGAQQAGWAMGMATACAIAGRSVVARLMRPGADRRLVAVTAYGVQIIGTLMLMVADGAQTGLILLAVALFGSGIGNATSLPPLIAQTEFAGQDVARVVGLIVAIAQGTYAFAPALFGLLLASSGGADVQVGSGSAGFFAAVAGVQAAAAACFWSARQRP